MISSIKLSLLAQLRCNQNRMICLNTGRARLVKGDHMQISLKLAANL